MSSLRKIIYCILFGAIFLSVSSCGEKSIVSPSPTLKERGPSYRLVLGGDFILGRRFNLVCTSKSKLEAVLGDVKPLLKDADLSMVNAEGTIAQSGFPTNKHAAGPIYYRAHPAAIHALVSAGIDVVTVANNHSGDYGSSGFLESLQNLQRHSISYTGGGVDIRDAIVPAYRKIGDLVVAFVGGEFPFSSSFKAGNNQPGILQFDELEKNKDIVPIVDVYKSILKEARKTAHVVLFSPHWGNNWVSVPSAEIRELAHAMIDAGYDGIFGHSAHRVQGIEIYNRKPIVYDMGNILIDWGNLPYDEHSFVFEARIDKAGISEVFAYPLHLQENQTHLSKGKRRTDALELLKQLSSDLGTAIDIKDAYAHVTLSPESIHPPSQSELPTKATIKQSFSKSAVLSLLPANITGPKVSFSNGIDFLGYRMLSKQIAPGDAAVIELFFQSTHPIHSNLRIHLEARGEHPKKGTPTTIMGGHIPGDWVLPTNEWPVGKIIRDLSVMRLNLKPRGEVFFFAGLWDGKQFVDEKLISLGSIPYQKAAPLSGNVLDHYTTSR